MGANQLKNLRKQGNTFYYDHGGKPRKWESLGTDEAKANATAAKLNEGRQAKSGTVNAMLRDFVETLPTRRVEKTNKPMSLGTIKGYRIYARSVGAVFGEQRPEELTNADIRKYMKTCKRTSWRTEISVLSMAFELWMDEGRTDNNPCYGVKVQRKRAKRTRLLADWEVNAALDKAPERIRVAVELDYATALRIGDICRLTWTALNEMVNTQKTGAKMAYESTADFGALIARARALQAERPSVFVVCQANGQPWTRDTLRKKWQEACAEAGVRDVVFHDIRAKAATDKSKAEGRKAAQEFLGHTNAQTTDVYLRDREASVVRPMSWKRAAGGAAR
jgi:integrase